MPQGDAAGMYTRNFIPLSARLFLLVVFDFRLYVHTRNGQAEIVRGVDHGVPWRDAVVPGDAHPQVLLPVRFPIVPVWYERLGRVSREFGENGASPFYAFGFIAPINAVVIVLILM